MVSKRAHHRSWVEVPQRQRLEHECWNLQAAIGLAAVGQNVNKGTATARHRQGHGMFLWRKIRKSDPAYPKLDGLMEARCGEAQSRGELEQQ